MLIYFAAPFFSAAERRYNEDLARRLEDEGFDVFLPQRDGAEVMEPEFTAMSACEQNHLLFEVDYENIVEADIFLFVLDGRVPDEGAAVELGIAYAHGRLTCSSKLLIGIQTDSRAAFLDAKINPMLMVPLEYVVSDEEELLEILDSYVKEM